MKQHRMICLQPRVHIRKRSQSGFTIIELLVALSLLTLITTGLAGGLHVMRKSSVTNARAQASAEADQAINILADQIAAAFPFVDRGSGRVMFNGQAETIGYIRLDQGRSNRAGLQQAAIRQSSDQIIMTLTPHLRDQSVSSPRDRSSIVLLDRVSGVRFRYFGAVEPSTDPVWRTDWQKMKTLPQLVSIEVNFHLLDRSPRTILVAMRQQ